MAMKRQQVTYLLDKLYNIENQLGVRKKNNKKKKGGGEFDDLKTEVQHIFYDINKKQDERDEKQEKYGNKDHDVIRLSSDIRDLLQESQKVLNQIDTKIRKMGKNRKKFSPEVIQLKDQIYNKLCEQFKLIEDRETYGFSDNANMQGQVKTLNEAKANLWGKNQNNNMMQNQKVNADDVEKQAMDRWKQQQQEEDKVLDEIIDYTAAIKHKVKLQGQKIDEIKQLEKKLQKEMTAVNKQADTANNRLKKLVKEYRKPNKFCMDMILICLLLGLVAVAYNMIKN